MVTAGMRGFRRLAFAAMKLEMLTGVDISTGSRRIARKPRNVASKEVTLAHKSPRVRSTHSERGGGRDLRNIHIRAEGKKDETGIRANEWTDGREGGGPDEARGEASVRLRDSPSCHRTHFAASAAAAAAITISFPTFLAFPSSVRGHGGGHRRSPLPLPLSVRRPKVL